MKLRSLKPRPPLALALLLLVGGASAYSSGTARSGAAWQPKQAPLMTRWAKEVSPANALPDYPRPQLARDRWLNLNGLWDFALAAKEAPRPRTYGEQILVPYPVESALSGVMKRVDETQQLWYRRAFRLPAEWKGQRTLLHFGAVDWEATVFVNGKEVGTHRGGYDPFSFDVTEALRPGAAQELLVRVYDPTDKGIQPTGKQTLTPRGIWYTPCSGIWQTVWLEPVPEASLRGLTLTPDVDDRTLRLSVTTAGTVSGHTLEAVAFDGPKVVGRARLPLPRDAAKPAPALALPVPSPKLWSPDRPFLYRLKVSLKSGERSVDSVASYFAMRKVSVGKDGGVTRLLLNGKPLFQVGLLDQGFWPDGIYTAPTDAALKYDLETTKRLGFNMVRKHIKVEPARWYYWADRLGLVVWQDMPSFFISTQVTPERAAQFETEVRAMVRALSNHPSIMTWVPFNEGWGQHDVPRYARLLRELDPTRVIDAVSGWQHDPASDTIDVHRYPGPTAIRPDARRASVEGEFGGLRLVTPGHLWSEQAWGYASVADREELTEQYERLIGRMWRYRDTHGMSGLVYTQTTDVETEANGVLTYDRAVIKMDPERIASANQGRTPVIVPDDHRGFVDRTRVEIFCWAKGADVRYTLDGSEPTAASPRYTGPFELDRSARVTARAFRKGRPAGALRAAEFVQGPGSPPAKGQDLEPGIRYSYFAVTPNPQGGYHQHPPLRRRLADPAALKPSKSGELANFDLSPREQEELFQITYTGFFHAPKDGVYRFTLRADDGALLRVGGQEVVASAGQSPALAETAGAVSLQGGDHPFTLGYFQAYGPAGLELLYEGPGIPKQPVPASALFRRKREGR